MAQPVLCTARCQARECFVLREPRLRAPTLFDSKIYHITLVLSFLSYFALVKLQDELFLRTGLPRPPSASRVTDSNPYSAHPHARSHHDISKGLGTFQACSLYSDALVAGRDRLVPAWQRLMACRNLGPHVFVGSTIRYTWLACHHDSSARSFQD